MNDLETTMLSARLQTLADETTPVVDPRRQVADARARHHRRRRTRIAYLGLATATAAVILGSAVAVGQLSARDDGQVAVPGVPTPTTTAPATSEPAASATPPAVATSAGPELPAGWEPSAFQGATFAVPPGATQPDTVEPVPVQADPATYIWHGPPLGAAGIQSIQIQVRPMGDTFAVDEGAEPAPVRGAQEAYLRFANRFGADPAEVTGMQLDVRGDAGILSLYASLPPGESGRQMARDFVAALDVTAMDGALDTLPDGDHIVLVHSASPVGRVMTIEPAEWLGSGRSLSCLPDGAVDVVEHCVGTIGARQSIGVDATEFTVAGDPPRQVGAAEFGLLVDSSRWDLADPQPLLGWVTVRSGKVVAFEEVPRQSR